MVLIICTKNEWNLTNRYWDMVRCNGGHVLNFFYSFSGCMLRQKRGNNRNVIKDNDWNHKQYQPV